MSDSSVAATAGAGTRMWLPRRIGRPSGPRAGPRRDAALRPDRGEPNSFAGHRCPPSATPASASAGQVGPRIADRRGLGALAMAYLQRQRKHWPKCGQRGGLLPEPTEAVIREMVEDFKPRHRGARWTVIGPTPSSISVEAGWKLRPVLLRQLQSDVDPRQMVLALERPTPKSGFVPWSEPATLITQCDGPGRLPAGLHIV